MNDEMPNFDVNNTEGVENIASENMTPDNAGKSAPEKSSYNDPDRYLPHNIRKRKIMKYMVALALFVMAITIALLFPYAVYAYENLRLTNYGIHYKTETVKIDAEATSFAEKLSIISDMLQKNSFIYIDSSEVDASTYRSNMSSDEVPRCAKRAVMEAFGNTYAELYNLDAEYVENALFQSTDSVIQPCLMIKPDTKEMFLVWFVYIYDRGLGTIQVVLDDETGKLLSLTSESETLSRDILREMMMMDSEAFVNSLSEYYNLKMTGEVSSSYTMSGKEIVSLELTISGADNGGSRDYRLQMIYYTDGYYNTEFYFNDFSSSMNSSNYGYWNTFPDFEDSPYATYYFGYSDEEGAGDAADGNSGTLSGGADEKSSGGKSTDSKSTDSKSSDSKSSDGLSADDSSDSKITDDKSAGTDEAGNSEDDKSEDKTDGKTDEQSTESTDNTKDKKETDKATATDATENKTGNQTGN